MKNNIRKKEKGTWRNPLSVTMQPSMVKEMAAFTKEIEEKNNIGIGWSFVLRVGLEELLKRKDREELVVNRKIDSMMKKANA